MDVPLTGFLAEFRTALRQEVEAAQENAYLTAVPLSAGRRIAQVGANFLYRFTLESALSLPGDTPGDLLVPDRPPVEVSVVSTDGMVILLSLTFDLGPSITRARLRSDLAQLMRKLIQRIELMAGQPNKGGDRILSGGSDQGLPMPLASESALDSEQRDAVASALGRDTTFIWGPPGTGKTTTIGAIGVELYRRNRSVLLVSHTNTAVDGALLKIAAGLGFPEDGSVLRIGEPVNLELQDKKELLLETHARRRSAAIERRLLMIERDLKTMKERSLHLQRSIEVCEWVIEARSDIDEMSRELDQLLDLRSNVSRMKALVENLRTKTSIWEGAAQAAKLGLQRVQELSRLPGQMREVEAKLEMTEARLAALSALVARAEQGIALPDPFPAEAGPNAEEQCGLLAGMRRTAAEAEESLRDLTTRLAAAEELQLRVLATNALLRRWKGLPSPDEQKRTVGLLRGEIWHVEQRRTEALDGEQRIIKRLRNLMSTTQRQLEWSERSLQGYKQAHEKLSSWLEWFAQNYDGSPADVLARVASNRKDLEQKQGELDQLETMYSACWAILSQLVAQRLEVLRDLRLLGESPVSVEGKLAAIQKSYRLAEEAYRGLDPATLRKEVGDLNERIRALEEEERSLREALKTVEHTLVQEAKVIATTLTRAYLRESILARRFDTVILDEASMAPIPALWAAAGLADASVVVVGDFKQLPPIVLSSHELAQKWLGRDVFSVAGIDRAMEGGGEHPCLVQLRYQYRMHPDISSICNRLIYDGSLRDGENLLDEREGGLLEWYRPNAYDSPVLLVDTSSLDAWVTSVPRGRSSSRLNLLSAVLCASIAEALLLPDRPRLERGKPPRLLICNPYRPHAALLQLLLSDQELQMDALAGTAHTFQGKEADVVLLDLVNDEPHWRVAMFQQDRDESTKRLLNVALTRARRRLLVVGDFRYIRTQARNAFLGHRLVPLLQDRYQIVDAVQLLKEQIEMAAAPSDRSEHARRWISAEEHMAQMVLDLAATQEQVVIYSPDLLEPVLEELEVPVRAALERLVRFYLITRTLQERSASEVGHYRRLEERLKAWGVRIIHKRAMRERLVLIDGRLVWISSTSPLGDPDGKGVAERRPSPKVAKECASVLRTRDLLRAHDDQELVCPICASEIVAAEGSQDVFYWRCIQDGCYSRNPENPFLKDGVIYCKSCASTVEYGSWADEPHWRCVSNKRHRQRVVKNHLKLPKMREMIPRAELRKLDRQFSLEMD